MKMKQKEQLKANFKIDELAIVLVVALIAIAVSVYEGSKKVSNIEAEKITGLILDGNEISFASGGVVDQGKLNQVKGMDYKELKNYLNAKQDFCMYMEDENGNILLAKGSPKLSEGGEACSK